MVDTGFMDWPFFEQRHRELAPALEAVTSNELVAIAEQARDEASMDEACRALVAKLGQHGFLNCACLHDLNDSFDVRSLSVSRDILARFAGLADFAFAMQGLGTGPLSLFGTEAQRNHYIPPVMRGERIAAFALSEPQAGSDVSAIATTAHQAGGDYVINGTKTWISNGGIADHYAVCARTGEASGKRGLSMFMIDADNPGLRVAERIQVMAPHPLATIVLEDCRVPKSSLVGKLGDGFKIAMSTLDIFRTTVGAAALGFARCALDEAIAWVSERVVFGRPLADYQLTQQKIAEMATDVDASALLVYRSAWSKDTLGGRNTRPASMAKLYATEAAQQVIDKAVQLLGGRGLVSGARVESLYREIRALRIYEGTSEIQKLIIANSVMTESVRDPK